MPLTLQVIYPITDETNFDFDYYLGTHMPLVKKYFGEHMTAVSVSRGLAGGQDVPPPFYAIATMTFNEPSDLDAAMAKAGPVLDDIPKFTNTTPQMLIGETVLRQLME
ncbi:EthD family reductase [Aliiruegeria sabulilitoris]|uniref:EthD family reductase n=1 Tax=Aliiruegeria sabulilitoris TaxID=1510458 RepID=UPI00082B6AE0|nr:EthD family reductase [Aliiruegeria sabulilitoris]NDR59395.1 EthD family reductase [Pseudoruegeria sp. M32A2M]